MSNKDETGSSIEVVDALLITARDKIELNIQADYDSDFNFYEEIRTQQRERAK